MTLFPIFGTRNDSWPYISGAVTVRSQPESCRGVLSDAMCICCVLSMITALNSDTPGKHTAESRSYRCVFSLPRSKISQYPIRGLDDTCVQDLSARSGTGALFSFCNGSQCVICGEPNGQEPWLRGETYPAPF